MEVDEKDHIDRDFIFEKKRQEALEKNLVVNLLGLIQEGYDADYETSRIQINMNTINKFMSEMHLKQPGFTDSACVVHLLKTKKELKNLYRLEIQPVFNMIWFMVNQKI